MGEGDLKRLKAGSFETDNPASFCLWLGEQDFVYTAQVPGSHEFARMERAGELAVVYDKGKIVCQGSQQDLLILLLEKGAREHPWLGLTRQLLIPISGKVNCARATMLLANLEAALPTAIAIRALREITSLAASGTTTSRRCFPGEY